MLIHLLSYLVSVIHKQSVFAAHQHILGHSVPCDGVCIGKHAHHCCS